MKKIIVNGESRDLVAEKVLPVIIYGEQYNQYISYGGAGALEIFNGFLDGRPVYFCYTTTDSDNNSTSIYLPLAVSKIQTAEASSDDSSSETTNENPTVAEFLFIDFSDNSNQYTVQLNLSTV